MKRGLVCGLVVGALVLAASGANALEWDQNETLWFVVHGVPVLVVDVWVDGEVEVTKIDPWDKNGMLTITVNHHMWIDSASCQGTGYSLGPSDTGSKIVRKVGDRAEAECPQSTYPCGMPRAFKGSGLGRFFPVSGAPGSDDVMQLTPCHCPCD